MEFTPKTGIKGLVENWRGDVIAAISVALIALPLSLGIALAAGAPAMAGIWSAVVGGVVYNPLSWRTCVCQWTCKRGYCCHPFWDSRDGRRQWASL